MDKKPFWKSKIIGVALLGLALAVVEHLFGPDAKLSLEGVFDMTLPLLVLVFRTYFSGTTIQ